MELTTQRLAGRRALITGAASGIGRATAKRFAAEGASIHAVDVNRVGCEETVAAISEAGGRATSAACDVSDPRACEATVEAAVAGLGGLDILCNIAGVLHFDLAEKLSDETWERVIGINLSGTFYMCRAALPHLHHEQGAIVNLASLAGIQAVPYGAAYCASKGGSVMLTKSLAVEHAKTGPRVNCICPGGVATPLVAGFKLPEGANPALYTHVTPRMDTIGKPEEIAALAAYLASDEARFVTGSAMTIDGGQGA